jgi:hypothetical protein
MQILGACIDKLIGQSEIVTGKEPEETTSD